MSTIALPSKSLSSLARKKPLSEQVEVGVTAVLVVIGLLFAVLSLSYLFYANEKATQDYQLRALEQHRSELARENEVLAMQIANLESLNNLENNQQIAKMVKPELLYLQGDRAVAKK